MSKETQAKKRSNKERLMDGMVDGLYELDDHLIDLRPPRIAFLQKYNDMEPTRQFDYLVKLSSSMNQAAAMIQKERDELGELLIKKEQQLNAMSKQMASNNEMLQTEVMRMNDFKQDSNKFMAEQNAKIKELEKTVKELKG